MASTIFGTTSVPTYRPTATGSEVRTRLRSMVSAWRAWAQQLNAADRVRSSTPAADPSASAVDDYLRSGGFHTF